MVQENSSDKEKSKAWQRQRKNLM